MPDTQLPKTYRPSSRYWLLQLGAFAFVSILYRGMHPNDKFLPFGAGLGLMAVVLIAYGIIFKLEVSDGGG